MIIYTPPGYTALGELLEQTGRARYGDDWKPDAKRWTRHQRGRGHVLAQDPDQLARRRAVVEAVRDALYTGALPAALLTRSGYLVEIPRAFWASQDGLAPLMGGEPRVVYGAGPMGAAYTGTVMIPTSAAKAWASETARIEVVTTAGAKTRATRWLRTISADRAMTKAECVAEMQSQFQISERAALSVWAEAAPESWKAPGRRKSPH